MKVIVTITETDAVRLRSGGKAEISTPLFPDSTFTGTIATIAREAEQVAKTFRTEIRFANPGGVLRSGITAKVRIVLQRHTDALFVPSEVIRSDGVQYSVTVVSADTTAQRRIVIPGPQSETKTMITSGLHAGDRVVVSGYQLATEGVRVRIAGQ